MSIGMAVFIDTRNPDCSIASWIAVGVHYSNAYLYSRGSVIVRTLIYQVPAYTHWRTSRSSVA